MQEANLTTSTHDCMVPHWERGEESAEIVTPRQQKLTILSLGSSPNTTAEGITAQVLVVKDYNELDQIKDQVRNQGIQ